MCPEVHIITLIQNITIMNRLHTIITPVLFCCFAVIAAANDDIALSPVGAPIAERTYHTGEPIDFQWDGFALKVDSGCLMHDLALSFSILSQTQVAPMPSYWVAVTGDYVGAYRLLPNGVHFSEPATISLPYDEYLLPMGYKPKDIRTYFSMKSWR